MNDESKINQDSILEELANKILKKECALFTGAGLTQSSGGTSWTGLIEHIIEKFNYDSILLEDWKENPREYQSIIDDIFETKKEKKEIYNEISERLKDVTISEEIKDLLLLPWFTIFTTNYDTAIEDALIENQGDRRIIPIFTGDEYALPGKQKDLYIVKLMGSRDIPYNSPGSMILTTGQKGNEEKSRSKIYDELGEHAANLSFLFVGYSFEDQIFIETIKRVKDKIGKTTNKFFVLFRNEPDKKKKHILEGLGAIIIQCDLTEFSKNLVRKYNLLDSDNYSKLRLLLGEKVFQIEKSEIYDFLDNYKPVDFNLISDSVSAYSFFRGKTESFYPYREKWHFKRKEVDELTKCILHTKETDLCNIICISGDLGSGRTTLIKSTIYELITSHNSIAIKIKEYAVNPFPNKDDIENFIKVVIEKSQIQNIPKPERIIFWAEYTPNPSVVLNYKSIADNLDFPIFFVFEEVTNEQYIENLAKNFNLVRIELSNIIDGEDAKELINYIYTTVKDRKFPEISIENISKIVYQEKHFLPIMYRTLNPTKDSIDEIIEQEFYELQKIDKYRDLILYCCIPSCVNLDMPISVIVKTIRTKFDDPDISYDNILDYGNNCYQFINIFPDDQTGYLFSIYHPIIAQKLIAVYGKRKIDQYLSDIIDVIDISHLTDARFISDLLITKGVNKVRSSSHFNQDAYTIASTNEGLLEAFKKLIEKQPARPIIHHYARLIHRLDPKDRSVINILKSAFPEPREKYQMNEPIEYIYTTLANFKWDLNKDTITKKKRSDKEIREIFTLLDNAKMQIDSIHPYNLQGRFLMDLWDNETDPKEKILLLNEAREVYDNGFSLLSPDDYLGYFRLNLLYQRIFDAINWTDPALAKQIADEWALDGDGSGYYFLARIAYDKGDRKEALKYLDEAMECDDCPPSTIVLKIKICINSDNPPYYSKLLALADTSIPEESETWESALYKGAIYSINGIQPAAHRFFRMAWRKGPRDKRTKISITIRENGDNKQFKGKISPGISEFEGNIYSHNVENLDQEIFFDPRSAKNEKELRAGMSVTFTLGYNSFGPVAIDVRSTETKI